MTGKKKKKEYRATFMLDPFLYEVAIVLSDDYNSTIDYLKLGDELHDKAGVSVYTGDYHILLFDIQHLDSGVIAHEAAHCVFEALNSVGQDPVRGEETFTYLLQHIVNFIHDMCRKHKIVVK